MPAASKTVRAALQHAAARTNVFAAQPRLLVAFSGGQDSTCLLHSLIRLRRDYPIAVIAAHVDHALRPESAADAARAANLARDIGADGVLTRRVDVSSYHRGLQRSSIQQAARFARYQTLKLMLGEAGASALLVAHTSDDQAETVLLNILRGAGLEGLSGMRLDERVRVADFGPALPGCVGARERLPEWTRIVRPLLLVARETTAAYCAEFRLPLLEDPSNARRAYTRNRLRLDLLPLLRTFNPRATVAVSRLADQAAEDLQALDALAEQLRDVLGARTGDEWHFRLGGWRSQQRGVQRRILRAAVRDLAGTLRDVPAKSLDDALDLAGRDGLAERTYNLPSGISMIVGRSDLVLRRAEKSRDGLDGMHSGSSV